MGQEKEKQGQGISKDHALKVLFNQPENFSAVFNSFFGEKEFVDADRLKDYDSASQFEVLKKGRLAVSGERHRDIIKVSEGKICCLLGIENQSSVDYTMPVRIFFYDALTYYEQVKREGFRSQQLLPVLSLVLYFGERPWTGPVDLLSMMPNRVKDHLLFQNYRMNLIDVRRMDENRIGELPSELAFFFKTLQTMLDGEKFSKFLAQDANAFSRLSVETRAALQAFFDGEEEVFMKGGRDMGDGLRAYREYIARLERNAGRREGRNEGRREGRDEGLLKASEYYQRKMREAGLSEEEIKKIADGLVKEKEALEQ